MFRIKHLSFLLIALFALTLSSCGGGGGGGGDDTPTLTAEEQRLLDLVGTTGVTYEATSITFNDVAATGFDDFTLTLRGTASSKTYSTTDGDPVFKATGSWAFKGTSISEILIDSNSNNTFVITNFSASAGTFTLTVDFVASGGVAAGMNGTNGTYVFNLVKQ
ncbi:hypothetical protein [Roseivirga seohaensis]|uniref:hypothetical protein n=1 Tax=Roseivirga seohaensis TaxID=1914963 RepID=UPI003BAD36A4